MVERTHTGVKTPLTQEERKLLKDTVNSYFGIIESELVENKISEAARLHLVECLTVIRKQYITITQMAYICGVTEQTIRNFEKGKMTDYGILLNYFKIASFDGQNVNAMIESLFEGR